MTRFRPGRWRNVLFLVTAALAHLGVIVVQSRIAAAPSAEWQAILVLLERGAERHFHAWRFARYCTVRGILPAAVDDAALETYLADLEHRSLVSEPVRAAREVARLWNAAADQHLAWPQCRLTVPDHRLTFSSPLSYYPQTLRDDIERWREWLGGDDPFTNRPFSPLRPASMATRLRQIRAYLGALVESGVDPTSMVDLAGVVTIERAGQALRVFWERAGRKSTAHTFQMAALVLQIGKYWAKLPEPDVEELRNMMRQLRPKHTGMSPRTEGGLRAAVEDQDRLDRLLTLPGPVIARTKAPRCALYARYSSDNQREASIEDQLRICQVRAEREGWSVVGTFTDAAISGATTLRPGYQALLEAIRQGELDIVLAESLDRLSRDLEHVAAFHKLAVFARVRIVTLAEGEISELHVGLKGTMGALYLKDLAQKTHRGLEGRARQGFGTGRLAYGYRAVRTFGADGEPVRGLREIDPAAAAVVRRIFRDYAGGASPLAIARALNAEGVPGPDGRPALA